MRLFTTVFSSLFPKDVELIKRETEKISAEVRELHNTNPDELIQVLLENRFDLIHISAYVNPKTGEIYFNDVNDKGIPVDGVKIDSIGAERFAKLIEIAESPARDLSNLRLIAAGSEVGKDYKYDRGNGLGLR